MLADQPAPPLPDTDDRPWYKTLTRYHWFVLTVAAFGWLFDTMDQQLFILARGPAMKALVTSKAEEPIEARARENKFAGIATSIFLIGWATGGLFFGVMGDRVGRAKTMLLTILLYSVFTGLSALSQGFWDFALYRFMAGLGVGGEFAVGVSLVAEVMPDKARPHALGLLQALSAVGNVTAALVGILLANVQGSWKYMFLVGTVPALLCVFIFRRLKEPERWQAMKKAARESGGKQKLGSLKELFGDPRWRKRAVIGLLLSSSGIIGLWAIGFFSFDLTRSVFRKTFETEARSDREADKDLDFVNLILKQPDHPESRKALGTIFAVDLLNFEPDSNDVQVLFKAAQALHQKGKGISRRSLLVEVGKQLKKPNDPKRDKKLESFLDREPQSSETMPEHVRRISQRADDITGRLNLWAGITSVMLNLGAALGIYAFTRITHFTGRRPAFAIAFLLAMASTAWVFWSLNRVSDVFWMVPIMGFCQLALFGGYAIYFPELFPTRLRSTGISFCYNVARYVAATGPLTLGYLSSEVFSKFDEPLRYAGLAMCSVFLIGLFTLPFAPETKGKPLPE
jgi:MFS family permease